MPSKCNKCNRVCPLSLFQAMDQREGRKRNAEQECKQQQSMQDTLCKVQHDLKETREKTQGLNELKRVIGATEAPLAQRIQEMKEQING